MGEVGVVMWTGFMLIVFGYVRFLNARYVHSVFVDKCAW